MNLIAVASGGIVGAILRYQMGQWIIPLPNSFPMGTLLINWLGCLFLGWFFTITKAKWRIHPHMRLAIGTGFTGAFTTFSTFSVETVHLMETGHVNLAFLYVILSVLGGLLLVALGFILASLTGKTVREKESAKEGTL